MKPQSFWQFRLSAHHLLANLASDLYENSGDCLWELVRNGVCACMRNDTWTPQRASVEVMLVDAHPLSSGSQALVILDRGSGFTEQNIELFSSIGPSVTDVARRGSRSNLHGAAQKRIGRFSAFALNRLSLHDRNLNTGFFILTRTASTGLVQYVKMIPAAIEKDQGVRPEMIEPDSIQLGPQRGIKGSFTAIVIPNSVYTSPNQIRDDLLWRIPRKPDKMFRLMVGKNQLQPPPIVSRLTIPQEPGSCEAYLDKCSPDQSESGVWFCDADTALRVASAERVGGRIVPYPLWRRELTGDIFIPGLLANQDTARTNLAARYLKSAAWKSVQGWLFGTVAPAAKDLLGNEDVFERGAASQSILDFASLCEDAYGKPEPLHENTGGGILIGGPGPKKPSTKGGASPQQSGENGHKPITRRPPGERVQPRMVPFRVRDRTFGIAIGPLDPHVLAQMDQSGTVVWFNRSGYVAMPNTREARTEHVVLKLLEAVAIADYPGNPEQVQRLVGEWRCDLLKAKSRKK